MDGIGQGPSRQREEDEPGPDRVLLRRMAQMREQLNLREGDLRARAAAASLQHRGKQPGRGFDKALPEGSPAGFS
jgi:hypothetical protein